MKKDSKYGKVLFSLSSFLAIFLTVAFIITCCMLLFISVMRNTMGLELTEEDLGVAAKLTFINVLALSLIFTVIDLVRRRLTVDRPVKRITEAAEKMTKGDFSVRIPVPKNAHAEALFGDIAECFNKMAEELSKTESLRSDFVANVSHELKTPLAVMQNYATMLQAPGLTESKRLEYSKAISDASKKLSELVTNILKLNKLENSQSVPSPEKYDLSAQVVECLLDFEDIWERKNINIKTDIEEGIIVESDPQMMTLVWNNLLSNAFKFTEADGTVSVSIRADENDVFISVSDTGCGISADVGAHIFDKFYQGDSSRATEGNGLGLALVKRIIDITGSDISVESELSVGTSFTVRMRRYQHGKV